MASGTEKTLQGVWGSGPADIFAVGSKGLILHYDGKAWSPMASGTDLYLGGIWGSGPTNVYVAGVWNPSKRVMLRYDGKAWSKVPGLAGSVAASAIWGSGPDDIFAVGQGGAILHFDGEGWSTQSSGTTDPLFAVWGRGPKDVWAAGAKGTLLRYDGKTWSKETAATQWISGLWGHGADLFTAAENVMACIGASTCSMEWKSDDGWRRLSAMAGAGDHGVAVGSAGTTLRYGGKWAEDSSGPTWHVAALWGSAPDDVWAGMAMLGAAKGYEGKLLHFDGERWSERASPIAVHALWGSGPGDVFAAGGGGPILRYDGKSWSEMPSSEPPGFDGWSALWGSGPEDVFAAGAGAIIHFDGKSWSKSYETDLSTPIAALWGTGPESVYAAGGDGLLLRFDGKGWTQLASPTTQSLHAIWGSGGQVFAAGSEVVLRLDGGTWTNVTPPGSPHHLAAVWGRGPDDVYFVGYNGTILHHQNGAWSSHDSGFSAELNAVWGIGSRVFVGGRNGAILGRGL
jgi:hypothetical protein